MGFKAFKAKVGISVESDTARLELIRDQIGNDRVLMVDANQVWGEQEAIDWMKKLKKFNLFWIEEPTAPDDVTSHANISKALNPLGIKVATGEHGHNRILHKMFLKLNGYQVCQTDPTRLGGYNECILLTLMCKKFEVPLCIHAGGVGLCELGLPVSIFDYICVSMSHESRWCEWADSLHEHFINPCEIKNGNYVLHQEPGINLELKNDSINEFFFS